MSSIWLWLYLSVGFLVLAGFLLHNYRTGKNSTSLLLETWQQSPPRPAPLKRVGRVVLDLVARSVASGVTIVAWPITLLFEIWTIVANRRTSEAFKSPVFEVKKSDLGEPLTREQIEARELVTDPLQAVPQIPFGHLHTAWGKFLENVQHRDVLWSFATDWRDHRGSDGQRVGYVILRGRRIGPYFLASIRTGN